LLFADHPYLYSGSRKLLEFEIASIRKYRIGQGFNSGKDYRPEGCSLKVRKRRYAKLENDVGKNVKVAMSAKKN